MTLFGCCLIFSAILKTTSSNYQVLAVIVRGFTPSLSIVIVSEFCAGIALVSGIACQAARICSMTLLIIFATINMIQGMQGEVSCGCFGKMTVPPFLLAAIEVSLVVALGILPVGRPWTNFDINTLWTVGILIVILVSVSVVKNKLNPPLTLEDHYDFILNVGPIASGSETLQRISWTNNSDRPVQLTFLRSGCSCIVVDTLPIWVEPHQSTELVFAFIAPRWPGQFYRKFTLLTSVTTLHGVVVGSVPE